MRRKARKIFIFSLLLSLCFSLSGMIDAHAQCGPDWIFYGTVKVNGQDAGASSGSVISAENMAGEELARYVMGSNPNAYDYYDLRIASPPQTPDSVCLKVTAEQGDEIYFLVRWSSRRRNVHAWTSYEAVL